VTTPSPHLLGSRPELAGPCIRAERDDQDGRAHVGRRVDQSLRRGLRFESDVLNRTAENGVHGLVRGLDLSYLATLRSLVGDGGVDERGDGDGVLVERVLDFVHLCLVLGVEVQGTQIRDKSGDGVFSDICLQCRRVRLEEYRAAKNFSSLARVSRTW
jgi:hypothetical protein